MHTRLISVLLFLFCFSELSAQETSTDEAIVLEDVIVRSLGYAERQERLSPLAVEVAEKAFLTQHFTGNLVQALEQLPGIRSMDIGSGFAKPMIRGMGFNRVAVVENGIKQEGQQWGSDHGLEIDAFNIERVTVRKGPSSLQYGSDAMGGVIDISRSKTCKVFQSNVFQCVARLILQTGNDLETSYHYSLISFVFNNTLRTLNEYKGTKLSPYCQYSQIYLKPLKLFTFHSNKSQCQLVHRPCC